MSFKASDGREFGNPAQARLYEKSLAERGMDDVKNAPGGEEHEHNVKMHGIVKETTIKFDGPGRWRHTATHADGTKTTSVHPEAYRAHQVQAKYLGVDQAPPAIETHNRSRSHPVGPKEIERIDREDGREESAEER